MYDDTVGEYYVETKERGKKTDFSSWEDKYTEEMSGVKALFHLLRFRPHMPYDFLRPHEAS